MLTWAFYFQLKTHLSPQKRVCRLDIYKKDSATALFQAKNYAKKCVIRDICKFTSKMRKYIKLYKLHELYINHTLFSEKLHILQMKNLRPPVTIVATNIGYLRFKIRFHKCFVFTLLARRQRLTLCLYHPYLTWDHHRWTYQEQDQGLLRANLHSYDHFLGKEIGFQMNLVRGKKAPFILCNKDSMYSIFVAKLNILVAN